METQTNDRKRETMLAVLQESFGDNFTPKYLADMKEQFLTRRDKLIYDDSIDPKVKKVAPSEELLKTLHSAYLRAQISEMGSQCRRSNSQYAA